MMKVTLMSDVNIIAGRLLALLLQLQSSSLLQEQLFVAVVILCTLMITICTNASTIDIDIQHSHHGRYRCR